MCKGEAGAKAVAATFAGRVHLVNASAPMGYKTAAMALAVGSRKSTIAGVASILAAMAVAAAVAGRSCRVSQPGPEAAVRDMLQAAKTGDSETVFRLLTPSTQERLEAEAKRATLLVGASMRFTAKDLISIANPSEVATPTDITVLDERNDRAVVEVVSPTGRSRVALVKIEGRWRIDMPRYGSSSEAAR